MDDYNKKYYIKHSDKIKKDTKKYYYANWEECNKRRDKWNAKHKDEVKIYNGEYYQEHKEELNTDNKKNYAENSEKYNKAHYKNWKKPKYHSDNNFRIGEILSARTRLAIICGVGGASAVNLLGTDIETVRKYLESKFLKGMTWENHSLTGWTIDHIKPISKFDLTKEEEQKKCFHYTNLQPLWYIDNIRKSNN